MRSCPFGSSVLSPRSVLFLLQTRELPKCCKGTQTTHDGCAFAYHRCLDCASLRARRPNASARAAARQVIVRVSVSTERKRRGKNDHPHRAHQHTLSLAPCSHGELNPDVFF